MTDLNLLHRPSQNFSGIQTAASIYQTLRGTRPKSRQDLKNYVKVFLGVDVPNKRICPEHNSPMDYLWHSFSADFRELSRTTGSTVFSPAIHCGVSGHQATENGDCIVWANRTGGKTELAAIATLLDCIFKPNCQVRILAGSGEQAGRMYQYLTGFCKETTSSFLPGRCKRKNADSSTMLLSRS